MPLDIGFWENCSQINRDHISAENHLQEEKKTLVTFDSNEMNGSSVDISIDYHFDES